MIQGRYLDACDSGHGFRLPPSTSAGIYNTELLPMPSNGIPGLHLFWRFHCLSTGGRGHLWVLHGFHGAVERGPQRGEADEDVHVRVLLHGVVHALVDWHQDLLVAPVELLLVVAAVQHNPFYSGSAHHDNKTTFLKDQLHIGVQNPTV